MAHNLFKKMEGKSFIHSIFVDVMKTDMHFTLYIKI